MFWFRLFARKVVDWRDSVRSWWHGAPAVEAKPPAVNPVANVLAAGLTPPVDALPVPGLNRKERRTLSALERARRKHDKFVEPKGELPPPKPRERTSHIVTSVVAPPAEPIKTAELFIADKHHEDPKGEDVLYRESEVYGEFNFRDTILEQLDSYFIYIERMKRNDREAYGLYKELGAMVVPYSATGVDRHRGRFKADASEKKRHDLSDWFNKTRPSFGCIVYGADPLTEKYEKAPHTFAGEKNRHVWVPKFLYFVKYKDPPPELQPMAGGDIYSMTVYWDQPWNTRFDRRRKGGVPQEYGIFISANGKNIQILRKIESKRIDVLKKIKKRDAHGNINFYTQIPQRCWRIPHTFEEWARDHGIDVQIYLSNVFIDAVQIWERANYSMVRVAASKGDITAVFGVNIKRLGYFFRDRDIQISESGTRKKAFHIVRAHERTSVSGKTYYVPFHFRGEHEFTWAGYHISITVPGRDHLMLPEIDVGFSDEYWLEDEDPDELISGEQLGKKIKDWMKQGVGGRKGARQ